MNGNFLSLCLGVGSNIIFAFLCIILSQFKKKFKAKNPKYSFLYFCLSCLGWIVGTVMIGYSFYCTTSKYIPLGSLFVLSCIFAYTNFRYIYQFWQLGLVGVDQSASAGIDYKKSLQMCQSKLYFHGVGASKLTESDEFERALLRCKQEKPIKFLLLEPNNPYLTSAAKRAEKDNESYHKKVLQSLLKIAKLKKERDLNIDVRFYKGKPLFRLMFIDDTLCLLSPYTELGVDDGSSLPQIHLLNSVDAGHRKSLYCSFENYFDQIWNNSKEWDFEEYIK